MPGVHVSHNAGTCGSSCHAWKSGQWQFALGLLRSIPGMRMAPSEISTSINVCRSCRRSCPSGLLNSMPRPTIVRLISPMPWQLGMPISHNAAISAWASVGGGCLEFDTDYACDSWQDQLQCSYQCLASGGGTSLEFDARQRHDTKTDQKHCSRLCLMAGGGRCLELNAGQMGDTLKGQLQCSHQCQSTGGGASLELDAGQNRDTQTDQLQCMQPSALAKRT